MPVTHERLDEIRRQFAEQEQHILAMFGPNFHPRSFRSDLSLVEIRDLFQAIDDLTAQAVAEAETDRLDDKATAEKRDHYGRD